MKCYTCGDDIIGGTVSEGKYYCDRHVPAKPVVYGEPGADIILEDGQKVKPGDTIMVSAQGMSRTTVIPAANEINFSLPGDLEKSDAEIQQGGGKRVPIGFRYDLLNPEFLAAMAMIAHHGSTRYDATPTQPWGQLNYQLDRLVGEKSPINHALAHIMQFQSGIPYDRWDGAKSWHLVAAAYNLMMAYFHQRKEEEGARND